MFKFIYRYTYYKKEIVNLCYLLKKIVKYKHHVVETLIK